VIGRRTAIGTGLPDLGNAHNPKANLINANLSAADLRGADLSGAYWITQTQLDQACGTDVELDPVMALKPCP